MGFDCIQGLIADIVLDFTGILGSSFRIHSQSHERSGENGVPLVDFFRSFGPFFR